MSRDWLAYFKAKRGMGAVICEGPEIEAACAEIEALLTRVARLEEALRFILDECDWEESMSTVCGDNRIGTAARRALAALVGEE